jgi:tetratricopeptide (TPR) repeat protein
MDDKTKQLLTLAREHYDKRDFDKAEQYLQRVMPEADGFADLHNMMGVIHHDRGRLADAKAEFERAVALNPKYTEASLNLAVTCNDLGDYAAAQRTYQQALAREAEYPGGLDPYAKGKIANLHATVAHAYRDVGLHNEAVHELRKAINLCPHFVDLRLELSNVYRELRDLAAARFELEEALRLKPSYVPARNALGVVLLVLGERLAAIAEWQQALQTEPTNKAAQMYLKMAVNPAARTEPPVR